MFLTLASRDSPGFKCLVCRLTGHVSDLRVNQALQKSVKAWRLP